MKAFNKQKSIKGKHHDTTGETYETSNNDHHNNSAKEGRRHTSAQTYEVKAFFQQKSVAETHDNIAGTSHATAINADDTCRTKY